MKSENIQFNTVIIIINSALAWRISIFNSKYYKCGYGAGIYHQGLWHCGEMHDSAFLETVSYKELKILISWPLLLKCKFFFLILCESSGFMAVQF